MYQIEEIINPIEESIYNPCYHQVVGKGDGPIGMILKIVKKGSIDSSGNITPAQVIVGKYSSSEEERLSARGVNNNV